MESMKDDITHTDPHAHRHATGRASSASVASTVSSTRYTCPMHPEIVHDAPGSCPKCGMALVPVPGSGEADNSELRDLKRRLWIGISLSVPLVVLAMAPMLGIH